MTTNEVWSWDITRLRGALKWQFFYLYVLIDIFSRYVVGWLVAGAENAGLAQALIDETCDKHGIARDALTLHSDRGSPMRAKTTAELLVDLGVAALTLAFPAAITFPGATAIKSILPIIAQASATAAAATMVPITTRGSAGAGFPGFPVQRAETAARGAYVRPKRSAPPKPS